MKKLFLKIEKPTPQEIEIFIERANYIEEKQRLHYADYSDVYDIFKGLCIKN